MADIIQEMRDLAGLPRVESKTLTEDPRETVQQWMQMAPKVVKHQGLKYTLKSNATVKSGETVYFKYWGPKPKGEVMAPIVQFVVTYHRGSDTYDVTVESYDINMNKTGERRLHGLSFDNFGSFGYLRDVMQESRNPVDDAKLADDIAEFDLNPERVRDQPKQYDSFEAAIADMQSQVFDGRRGTERRSQKEEKDDRIFRMFSFYKGSEMIKKGSIAVPEGKDAERRAKKAAEDLLGYDPGKKVLSKGGWEVQDDGTGKAFWVKTQVKHFLDPENRRS